MGSQFPYQRLSTWVEDVKEKTHQLSQRILHLYARWGKKHYWCAGVILILFVTTVVVLSRQVPEVHPETDRKLLDANAELRKEISALKANITALKMEMEALGKEKAKLGEEGQALRGQLADTTQHLEEARMGLEDLRGRLGAMNQTLSDTRKQLEESTRQEQMQVDLELANGKLKEALRQRDACHTQLEEKIAHYNAELKKQQAVNEELKNGINSVSEQLENVQYDRSNCQARIYQLVAQLKPDCHYESLWNNIVPWIGPVAFVLLLIYACVNCCK